MDEGDRSASDEDVDESAEPVEPDGDETVEPDGDETVEPDGDEPVEPDGDETVEGSHRSARSESPTDETSADAAEPIEFADGSYSDEISTVDPTESSKPPTGSADTTEDEVCSRDEQEEISLESGSDGEKSLVHRFRHNNDGALMWLREMLSSVAIVLVLGLILFAISGVWPPMVAVESGSMEPNMQVGDLVLVTEPGRFAPDAAGNDIGVVTHEEGMAADYRTFGSYGSVVIFQPPGRTASPIIHRVMFHVEEGENWHERADDQYHSAADCGELRHCPAPHDGFITLGDNNAEYDQANGLAAPVKADWVTGVARLRVPYLGYVRLIATGQAELGDVLGTSVGPSGSFASDLSAPVADAPRVSSGDGVNTAAVSGVAA